MIKKMTILYLLIFMLSCERDAVVQEEHCRVSGIYPHLAMYNNEGECGTGAVVSWADKLWVITYGPHKPKGSSDKLYEISMNLDQTIRKESIGGTPANRMIHKESEQLFIGPYVIDKARNVRTIPYEIMAGRHTGNARHLKDPENKVYYGTMEEGFYEVNVNDLHVKELYRDGNLTQKKGEMAQKADLLVGAHGKGLYSGQGVLVYSNNGEASAKALTDFDIEAGVLAEWSGKDWKVVRRNQFVEVIGPGGIYGNENPETDPIWATGWDHKSVILGVREPKTGWSFFRLPKASNSYDGAHGWNTEWPRIRNVGTGEEPDYLMTMHGMFWRFPKDFSTQKTAGIRPRSAYLKVIGDFTRWNDQLVFGCDDSAQKEFLNKRKQKGGIEGPGQSNSNLWFTSLDKPDNLGPITASGAVWINEEVKAGQISEPMLFSGWYDRIAWVKNQGKSKTDFVFQVDKNGTSNWETIKTVTVKGGTSSRIDFRKEEKGEWIRVKTLSDTKATVSFNYATQDYRDKNNKELFKGFATVNDINSNGGLLYGLGNNRKVLGVSAMTFDGENTIETGYYELDEMLNLIPKVDSETNDFIKERFAIPQNVVEVQESSVLITDDKDRRWRLPLGDKAYQRLTDNARLRICREVATERDLFNCCGTFYELPAENADGFAKIRPIASHNFQIHDYASYRGLLVMTGLRPDAKPGKHIVRSDDGKVAVWVGTIDDIWEMGKPTGHGGPWFNEDVEKDVPSDPYLFSHYGQKTLELSHKCDGAVTFKIEVEPIGHGPWMLYDEVTVQPGQIFTHQFPKGVQARWIRFSSSAKCVATAYLNYE